MSSLLNIFGLLLLTSMVMCNSVDSMVPRFGKRSVTNEFIDMGDLTPPQDPAINTFPKAPTVPLIPTCLHAGYFRDPFNCGKFYHCHHSQAIARTYYCQHGLIFNEQTERCEDPYFVDC